MKSIITLILHWILYKSRAHTCILQIFIKLMNTQITVTAADTDRDIHYQANVISILNSVKSENLLINIP
jgi:hypothetical protein